MTTIAQKLLDSGLCFGALEKAAAEQAVRVFNSTQGYDPAKKYEFKDSSELVIMFDGAAF